MAPLTNNEKKSPLLPMAVIRGLKEIVAPLKEGEEETHCRQ